uniref:OmpH family outer membrane protein n=2 Tax=Alloprevotella sp. TaxID=1872471 RepID=UPI0040266A00
MKNLLSLFFVFSLFALTATAQSSVRFGYVNVDSLLHTLPAYAEVQTNMEKLRAKYAIEAEYNESSFRRQYAEYLQGQKQFTPNILAKRQADLQESLQKGLRFRQQADSLLRQAEAEMLRPIRQNINAAIRAVGLEHGYEYILDTSTPVYPFIHPSVGEDVTAYIKEKLQQ